jgi:hypothetical protein
VGADTESLARIVTAVRTELQNDRRSSFWPNFWVNLSTNFIVGLVFFGLGVVVTLYLSQPH